MNPQPSDLLCFLVLMSFFAFVLIHYFSALYNPYKKTVSKSFDYMIPIGVIEPIVAVKPPISKPKNTISAPFLADCVSALVSLGFKKKEATVLSIDIINSKNPSSVEEFIRLVFTK